VGIFASNHTCAHSQIDTDTSHFYPGGYVTVTVACQVDLSGVSIPGIPASTTVTASATAPIDPYRAITSGFSLSEGSLGSNPSGGGGL
jgi:hypothetical protein